MNVVAIKARIVNFGNENDGRIFPLYLRQRPFPELDRYHLGHIATESVDTFRGPIKEDVKHLLPRIWNGGEMPLSATKIIDAVVELYGFVPIVFRRPGSEVVVSRSLCRDLFISAFRKDIFEVQLFCRKVVEVVLGRERTGLVIIFAKVANTFRLCIRMILACNMIGNEIDDDLQSCFMCPFYQEFELTNTLLGVFRKVWIYVIIVANSIWTACFALHHIRVIDGNSISRIIRLACVFDDSRIPDMSTAKSSDLLQSLGCKVFHQAAPVLLLCSERNAVRLVVAEQTGEDLIDGHVIECRRW